MFILKGVMEAILLLWCWDVDAEVLDGYIFQAW